MIFDLIKKEEEYQKSVINLIASENVASQAVMRATGSCLTNKYAEGYPGKRYYAGCSIVDEIETEAIHLCKKLFGAEHANVQPHSGSNANMAVYLATLKPGDVILGMKLAAGGHLTHGHTINISGKYFTCIGYGVHPTTHLIDFDEVERLAIQHQPKIIVAGASAYSRVIDYTKFREIADRVGALLLADIAHIAGLIVTGLHPSPIGIADFVTSTTHKTLRGPRGGIILCKQQFAEQLDKAVMPGTQGGPLMHVIAAKGVAFAEALQPDFKEYQRQVIRNTHAMAEHFKSLGYQIVTGGTDNHLFVVNFANTHPFVTGKEIEGLLERNNIIVNRNLVPQDPKNPLLTSGIRIGTAAMTTRGWKVDDAISCANHINKLVQDYAGAQAQQHHAQQQQTSV